MAEKRTKPTDILVAKETGWVDYRGEKVLVRRGITRARAGSEMVETHPDLFEPIDVHYEIEQMTAAPGELRG